ncbi:hypothetical protein MMC14_010383 [Varicellaria rhodocarpa]|nr:hypothetical protein [Varicellaria rhodocarpa]
MSSAASKAITEMDSKKMRLEKEQVALVRTFTSHMKAEGYESPWYYLDAGYDDEVFELWKDMMGDTVIPPRYLLRGYAPEPSQPSPVSEDQLAKLIKPGRQVIHPSSDQTFDAKYVVREDMAPEERQVVFIRLFANFLKSEDLRSPRYYIDKSQCLSFHENASPAEMARLKASSLKRGYIEPEELIKRLSKLKESDDFTLPKYRHRRMEWDKSPIREQIGVVQPPDADWFLDQIFDIGQMRKQIRKRIRKCSTKLYERESLEAGDHWDKVCNIELMPLPDLYLLKNIGHSPSGTLFPRYLVKGLYELRERANERGEKYYDEEYKKAKVKRREVIDQWQEKNPDSILADDPLSIYRTWPSELMDQLDAVDREAIRRGSERYMEDLRETEKKMQTLADFWRGCGLVTGQRTPPSPQWPDPKAKLRGKHWPDYLMEILSAISLGEIKGGDKRRYIEIARWQEAILNGDSEPTASDTPFPAFLMDELGVIYEEHIRFFDMEEMEDEMILRIAHWRKSEHNKPCPDRHGTPSQSNLDAVSEEAIDRIRGLGSMEENSFNDDAGGLTWTYGRSLSGSANRSADFTSHEEKSPSLIDQSSAMTIDTADQKVNQVVFQSTSTPKLWSSLPALKESPKKSQIQSRELDMDAETVTQRSAWWHTLRSRRKASKPFRSPAGRPQGITKRDTRKTPKKTQQLATKGHTNRPSGEKLTSPNISPLQHPSDKITAQTMPVSAKEGKKTKKSRHHRSNLSKTSSPQGVQKVRNVRSKACKAQRRDSDTRSQELPHLPTPPRSQ